jgi:site-specific recombinase XerD
MSASLALMHSADASPLDRAAAFQALREMVLNAVVSEHSKRNYAKALDEVFALCEERKQPLSRALLMEYRAAMLEKKLSASTVNVRLSAVRKLIGEAQRNGIIGAEEAANLAGVPNLSQKGTRMGNWLTREQAKELLTVPDRSKIKAKRDYAILALLLGCALRRQELASLDVDGIEMREGRSLWEGRPSPHRGDSALGQARNRRLDDSGQDRGRPLTAAAYQEREVDWRRVGRLGDLG